MAEDLIRLQARRDEAAELLEEMTAMGVYDGTLNVLRSRIRKLDEDITTAKARKIDPFHKIIAFRGGKVPDHLPVIPQSVIDAGIQMQVERRSRLLRNALVEEGADPDHVDAINDPAWNAPPVPIPPIPQDIIDRVSQRMARGEFDEPFSIPLPKEGP